MGEFAPGNAACGEGYWQALLNDEEMAGRGLSPQTAKGAFDKSRRCPDGSTRSPQWPVEGLTGQESIAGQRAWSTAPWQAAREALESGLVLELPVIDCNRGGLVVSWNGLQGFVPASHLRGLMTYLDEAERQLDLEQRVGTWLQLRVIEVDPEQGRFVLSERATQVNRDHRQRLLDELCPGNVCTGRVTNLCSFGAFVDLGGLEGLVHISELSWGRVNRPDEVLQRGQEVEVYVLHVDRKRDRVGLSVKRLQPDPWQTVEERYQVGQIVEGTITNVVDFGAFARIEKGLEGLIHVSELAEGSFLHPRSVVQEGDVVQARILNVDGERRRLGLSLRQVAQSDLPPEPALSPSTQLGTSPVEGGWYPPPEMG